MIRLKENYGDRRVRAVLGGARWCCAIAILVAAGCGDTPGDSKPDALAQTANSDDLGNLREVLGEIVYLNTSPDLQFEIVQGEEVNYFYRNEQVSAHVVPPNPKMPHLRIAFPAGNTGYQLDLGRVAHGWGPVTGIRAVKAVQGDGAPFYGVEFDLTAASQRVEFESFALTSVRVVRAAQAYPEWLESFPVSVSPLSESKALISRARLDSGASYAVVVDAVNGSIVDTDDKPLAMQSDGGPLVLRITGITNERVLTPIHYDEILRREIGGDPRTREILAFLSYREKLLAGSWRYLTYFGRDTLLSVKLLMPVASRSLIEAGIASVIERLNDLGEVAHEEDIGEMAVITRQDRGEALSGAPVFAYHMIDDDYMLLPVLAEFADAFGVDSLESFLKRRSAYGESYGDAVLRNLRFVLSETRPFAHEPKAKNLLHIKEGRSVGEWRDSGEGLGGGRVPYNVNAVLAPAALQAAAELIDLGVFGPYEWEPGPTSGEVITSAAVWSEQAPRYFLTRKNNENARSSVAQYAAESGVPAGPALDSLGTDEMVFDALSLGADLKPVPVLHSDYSFTFAFGDPDIATLRRAAEIITSPFPAGLLTPVGMVVANPVFVTDEFIRSGLDNGSYHGTVVWSWQQAMMLAGLNRQLKRSDIDDETRSRLEAAKDTIRAVVNNNESARGFELWSWSIQDDEFRFEAFGQRHGDQTESNAAQLWSAAYLGVEE